MVNFPGRNGRRRRVLNEEVLSASTSHVALRTMARDDEATEAPPRYSDAASVENHPQVTDFVPRRYRTVALLVLSGVAMTSVLGIAHHFQASVFARVGLENADAFDMASGGSVSAWVQSVVLLTASALCMLIYSIRRHRIDDIRGRYRIWLAATIVCLLLSANSAAGLHQVVADVLGSVTGWTKLRGGAIWWLVLGGLPATWILVRTLLDVRECRLSTSLLLAAVACYIVGAASFLGAVPTGDVRLEVVVANATVLMGHWLVLAAAVSQARFVILDAQGLIPLRPRIVRKGANEPSRSDFTENTKQFASAASPKHLPHEESPQRHSIRPARIPDRAAAEQWVDGSCPERDPYDDGDGDDGVPDDGRKLSKSDRKRMRKLKAQHRAA